MNSLAGKVAIVTGASKGIGKSTALSLAAGGASVVVNYSTDDAAANQVIKTVGNKKAVAVKADVSTISGVESLVRKTLEHFGKIDILILNAGVLPMKDLEHTTAEDFDRTFALNVKGPYFLCQKAVPHMRAGSHIIFLSTTLTTASTVGPPYLLYNATKGAIEQMTRVLCKDLGKKAIFVNAVAPGPTGTELFYKGKSEQVLKMAAGFSPHNRIGTPDEVAQTIVFLSSAPWISGQVVRVNGGMA
ncbi:hypothetical protein EPUS_06911 [Endocarpon pusillum Z07020]|uniref:Versicolorin reductase n=1 Tax=Endocarpon pusillum (strain Z07020 / HMAS-L-300199) TaxID=1263415 RepID=U1HDK9_ENDPU|nr:uncharacterized protein EPUS_06911 [Endocarpon pusillum Z07020]ERF68100.1 hypothetical protein EPUS_06911 [Endocarpon pusillum Z07020]